MTAARGRTPLGPGLAAARTATGAAFVLNGLCFATWVSRIPQARRELELGNAGLGLLLLTIAVGSLIALPLTGALIGRFGVVAVTRVGVAAAAGALVVVAGGVSGVLAPGAGVVVTALALAVYGSGSGAWDVAMNVEAAEVERGLGRTVMPRFHAGFSLGTVLGAGLGVAALAAGVPVLVHLGGVAVLTLAVLLPRAGAFLAVGGLEDAHADSLAGPRPSVWSAWTEPRTLLIGVMVMMLALMEGTANDWLALALVDGHGYDEARGVAGYAAFVSSMTLGRLGGPLLLDRLGRTRVLWATLALAAVGVLLVVLAEGPWVVVGVVLWGLGASLGFPVGMSAAADDPVRSAARVSVVSTLGYAAFLTGPPLFGALAETVGTLEALLALAVLTAPAALLVPAAREGGDGPHRRPGTTRSHG